jgi:hypothetical protein
MKNMINLLVKHKDDHPTAIILLRADAPPPPGNCRDRPPTRIHQQTHIGRTLNHVTGTQSFSFCVGLIFFFFFIMLEKQ